MYGFTERSPKALRHEAIMVRALDGDHSETVVRAVVRTTFPKVECVDLLIQREVESERLSAWG